MIYAMFGMAALTFAVGGIAVATRIKSIRDGSVEIKYFRVMEGQDVPEFLTRSTRSVNNMFEVPTLFYVVSILFVVQNIESNAALVLAWLFVISRYIHAGIHLTYNDVMHRVLVFWVGIMIVFSMWMLLLFSLA
ncbi:MAG: MAPEG family protein [Chloroflexota bacterium]